TTIAQIVAREMVASIHERIGQVLVGTSALNGLLMQAAEKDIVLIDEAHEMPRSAQTLLYRAMEDGRIFIRTDNDTTLTMMIKPFTMVLATTDEYALLQPLRDRCKIVLPFGYYGVDAVAQIVKQRATMMQCVVANAVAHEIAQRARGTPRLAIRLLEACHRMARSIAHDGIEMEHFQQTVVLEQIDSLGLGKDEQAYLSLLARRPGEAVRLFTLESVLGIHRRTIQSVIEPYLVREGLIERGTDGRQITEHGLQHVEATAEANALVEGEASHE
ncbi:MAG: AAA family ATPase, partial [Phycisphaerae bacterium]|nr:AAA family ATPase [Phycisphaerae bacterium]